MPKMIVCFSRPQLQKDHLHKIINIWSSAINITICIAVALHICYGELTASNTDKLENRTNK